MPVQWHDETVFTRSARCVLTKAEVSLFVAFSKPMAAASGIP